MKGVPDGAARIVRGAPLVARHSTVALRWLLMHHHSITEAMSCELCAMLRSIARYATLNLPPPIVDKICQIRMTVAKPIHD